MVATLVKIAVTFSRRDV
ncbi:MAG: hypothetical protein DMD30_02735 [Gemmatimonadetes bacterium]|nr:MAG: hypothetical protein DMD30_02735 [Gemmatimonadota bacterium]PYP53114.1 MAG: hypothetical protein DMD39_05745 [Gemmatimonadota bacterium]